jgi:hypothetical protein
MSSSTQFNIFSISVSLQIARCEGGSYYMKGCHTLGYKLIIMVIQSELI